MFMQSSRKANIAWIIPLQEKDPTSSTANKAAPFSIAAGNSEED